MLTNKQQHVIDKIEENGAPEPESVVRFEINYSQYVKDLIIRIISSKIRYNILTEEQSDYRVSNVFRACGDCLMTIRVIPMHKNVIKIHFTIERVQHTVFVYDPLEDSKALWFSKGPYTKLLNSVILHNNALNMYFEPQEPRFALSTCENYKSMRKNILLGYFLKEVMARFERGCDVHFVFCAKK